MDDDRRSKRHLVVGKLCPQAAPRPAIASQGYRTGGAESIQLIVGSVLRFTVRQCHTVNDLLSSLRLTLFSDDVVIGAELLAIRRVLPQFGARQAGCVHFR